MTTATAPQPFRIAITDSELDDLQRRLDTTRWPEPPPDTRADFERGVPLAYLQELTDYWRHGFDWRAQADSAVHYRDRRAADSLPARPLT
jgi:hypothetical protein